MQTGLFSSDGMIHAAPRQFGVSKKPKDVDAESVNVCLNCTRKKCRGSYECFKRRKTEQKEK